MKNTDEFYTAEELAEKLRVNIMTIYRYIKAGKIKAYKFGKEFRVEKKKFEPFPVRPIRMSDKTWKKLKDKKLKFGLSWDKFLLEISK